MAIAMFERNRYGVIWSRVWRGNNANGEPVNVQTGSPDSTEGTSIMEAAVHHKLRLMALPPELDLILRRRMMEIERQRLRWVLRNARQDARRANRGGGAT